MIKVIFCQRFVYSYFGIMYISALLKRGGHDTELVMETDVKKTVSEIVHANPDIVMFSTLTATGDFDWSLEVAKGIKQKNKNILTAFGGMHPTLFPEESMSNEAIDFICVGEGELPALELCNQLEGGASCCDIPGLWARSAEGIVRNPVGKLVEDLDVLPFPDRDLYQKYGYFNNLVSIDVIAGRGCPYSCSYCMNTTLKDMNQENGKFIRKHSPALMVRQLEELKKKFGARSFTFVDELFTVNKKWVKEFAGLYRERVGLPFTCNITPETVNEEVIVQLKQAGVFRVCMGVETGNEKIRHELLNKRLSNARLEEAARRLHTNGIKFLTSNMLGLPGETVNDAFETIAFNRKIKTDFVYFSVFQPYPGLFLTEKLQREGSLGPVDPSGFNSTFFKGSLLKQDNIGQLANLHKFFFVVFKFPWLKPLVRLLIRLPANWFFDQIFILSYAWLALTCFRRHPLQLLAMGLGNTKIFFGDRGVSR